MFHLSRCNFLEDRLFGQLINYYNRLDLIDLIPIPPETFKLIEYTSLNERYRPILNLCEIFLLDTSLNLDAIGDRTTNSFLIDMNRLFEKFVANLLAKRLDSYLIRPQDYEYIEKNCGRKVRGDILVSYHGRRIIVLDTKYKRITNDPEHTDLAQMNLYCDAYNDSNCGLIYAGSCHDYVITELRWVVKLHTFTIDLTEHNPEKFDKNCSKFVDILTSRVPGKIHQ